MTLLLHKMLTYYKLPTMQLNPRKSIIVPLFYKIKKTQNLDMIQDYPVHIDPTRRVK